MRNFSLILLALGMAFSANAQLSHGPVPTPGQPFPTPPPGYNDVYGPARTVRWEDMGVFRAEKFFEMEITLNVHDQFVNEVFVAPMDNDVDVTEALAYMSNGQVFRLNNMIGTAMADRQYRITLDYRNSLRLERLVYRIKSGNLIGPVPTLAIQLGLAY